MLLLLISCGPKKATSTDGEPFPLIEGARYHYSATFNGMHFQETRVVVPYTLPDGTKAYGFVEEDEVGQDVVSLFTGHFGLGLYRNTGAAIETAPAFWQDDITALSGSSFQPMLDLPLAQGASIRLDTDSPDRSGAITVVELGPKSVPAGSYSSCARIDLGQNGSFAWICDGVGLVEWTFVTGRVETLEWVEFQ